MIDNDLSKRDAGWSKSCMVVRSPRPCRRRNRSITDIESNSNTSLNTRLPRLSEATDTVVSRRRLLVLRSNGAVRGGVRGGAGRDGGGGTSRVARLSVCGPPPVSQLCQ